MQQKDDLDSWNYPYTPITINIMLCENQYLIIYIESYLCSDF